MANKVTGFRGAIEIRVAQARKNLKTFANEARATAKTWADSTKKNIEGSKRLKGATETVKRAGGAMGGAMQRAAGQVAAAKKRMVDAAGGADRLAMTMRKVGTAAKDAGAKWMTAGREMARSATRIATVVTASAGLIVGSLTKIGFEANSTANRAKIAFETLTGSAQQAQSLFDDLQRFAAKTPFEFLPLLQQAGQLLAQGFQKNEIVPTMTAVGDAVAAIGGGDEVIHRVIRALSQMRAKGKITAEEMLQMAEAQIPAWQLMADVSGKSVAELHKLSERGLIDAETGIAMILEGMQRRFGGTMDKMGGTWSQVISNMADNLYQFARNVVEPLFNRATELGQIALASMGSGRFTQMTENVRAAFARLAETVFGTGQQMLQTGSLIDFVESAIVGSVDAVNAAVSAFREYWPEIKAAAEAFGKFLGTVTEFMMEHPQVMAALAALKVAGFLGLTSAVKAVSSAIWSTLMIVGQFADKAALAQAATTGWQVALAALVAYGAYKFTQWLFDTNRHLEKYNAELERAAKLTGKMQESTNRRQTAFLADVQGRDPNAARVLIQKELERAKKNEDAARRHASSQSQRVEDTRAAERDRIGVFGGGPITDMLAESSKLLEMEKNQLKEAESAVENAERWRRQLEAELKRADAAATQSRSHGPTPGAAAMPVGGDGGSMGGLPDLAGMEAQRQAEAAAARRAANEATRRRHMESAIHGAAGAATSAQTAGADVGAIRGITSVAANARQQFQGGGSKEAFDRTMSEVRARLGALAQSAGGFGQQLANLQGVIPTAEFDGLNQKFVELQNQLAAGDISVDQFKQSIQQLDQAAKQADLERQSRGEFTEDEFQKALLQRAAAIQRQKMQEKVNEQLEKMGLITEKVTDKFDGLGDSIEKTGGAIRDGFEKVGEFSQQQAENLQRFGQFLNSREGQATNLFNNIQSLAQNLTLGVADTFREQRAILQQIEAMNAQLASLTAPVAPILRPTESDFLRDPALAGAGGGGSVTVQFPNVAVDSPRMARQVYDALKREGRRRGRSGM